jgi:hypothetical protein
MGQEIAFLATNEDLDHFQRLQARWPRWDYQQLLRKALAMAAQQVESQAIDEAEKLSPFRRNVEELFGKQDW